MSTAQAASDIDEKRAQDNRFTSNRDE